MERRKRSEVGVGTRVPSLPRTPDGTINNCALANGAPESECQMCPGTCPDHARFEHRVGLTSEAEEQRAGEDAFAAAAGDEWQVVEVTWGEELFQPVQYNSFRVGPFKVVTTVRRGETIGDAMLRVHRQIAAMATVLHDEKAKAYLQSLADLAGEVKRTSVR